MVRRLHARLLDGRLDGLSARRDPDARRARPGGRRRDVPGADLAPLHGAGREGTPGPGVRDAERLPGLHVLPEAATTATSPSRRRRRRPRRRPRPRPRPRRSRPASSRRRDRLPRRCSTPGGVRIVHWPRRAADRSTRRSSSCSRASCALERGGGPARRGRRAACSPRRPRAAVDLPPFPASAMDGFALRAADVPGHAAGRRPDRGRPAGRARARRPARRWRSRPAASFPTAPTRSSRSRTSRSATASSSSRRRRDGRERPAARRRPRRRRPRRRRRARGSARVQLGALAAAGVTQRALLPRGRAWCVVVTGTELRVAGEPLAPGEIYDANGVILATQIASAGASVERLPPVRDDEQATRAALERGLDADVLVTSGGVSVGVHDLVRARRGRARRRGGLLAGRRAAGQADRVRRARPHARLRAAGQPGLLAGRLRALRAPGAARAAGRRRAEARVPAGRLGLAGAAGRAATRCYGRVRGSRAARSCSIR